MLLNKIYPFVLILCCQVAFYGCTKTEPSAFQKESFIKNFGGAYEDQAIDILKDNGHYYILGNVADEDANTLIYLAKTDEFGNRVWEKDLTYSVDEKPTHASQIIKLSNQSGFAIIGSIEIDDDLLYFDTFLLIINEDGEILSENTFSNSYTNDHGKCIAELDNGGFIISILSTPTNGSGSFIDLITTSSTGEFIRRASPIFANNLYHICKKKSGDGYYIAAYSTHPFIILLNAEGKFGGTQNFGSINGEIRSITQDKNGNTLVCGILNSGSNGSNDGFIAQLENVEKSIDYTWLNAYGKTGIDYLEHLLITENNEILLKGSTENPSLDTYDIWVLKTDISGNFLNETIIGGENNEYGVRILEQENNNYVVEGTTYFDKTSMISIFKSKLK
jgi:hypothetical protein